ncbi:hypothetical protein PF002_g5266 [Phytophthora fragariae]|uniref:Uncharacterized protein n=1 Tax=Phytophthora fragariae TaxID=53985 RepID=A0A6A3L7T7_9STRA|nr:hypothetical protein PF011_g7540 [Phytophthora fragariae]KAE9249521.1 hypothetical protein PF002_g5266 [Phytophthora fragariae]
MGQVDGLSRLYSQTICAVSTPELSDDSSANRTESFIKVGERPNSGVCRAEDGSQSGRGELDQKPKAKKPLTGGGEEVVEPTAERDASVLVGEPLAPFPNRDADDPDFADSLAAEGDDILEDDDVEHVVTSPVDRFGLDRERFTAEQKRSPRIQAVIAFIEYGALALNDQLRVKVLQMMWSERVWYRSAYT